MGRKESNQKTQAGKDLNANGAKISFRLFISLEILTLNLSVLSVDNLSKQFGPRSGPT